MWSTRIYSENPPTQEENSSSHRSSSQLCHVAECQKVRDRAGKCRFKQTILIRGHPGPCRAKPPFVCQLWFMNPGGRRWGGLLAAQRREITRQNGKRERDKEDGVYLNAHALKGLLFPALRGNSRTHPFGRKWKSGIHTCSHRVLPLSLYIGCVYMCV